MTLIDVITLFDTDERCREMLVRLRWPNGIECPRCKMPAVELETAKQLFYCKGCDYQFSVTTGTVFNDSHLPLQKWFLATLLLCEAKKGMSALQLKRTLWGQNKGSYKTAWYLCHRIRFAMTEVQKMLDGTIEVDETYVGGKRKGIGTGNYRDHKQTVIGIIQRSGNLKFIHVKDANSKTIREVLQEHDLVIGERSHLLPIDGENAEHGVTLAQRHQEEGTNAAEFDRGDAQPVARPVSLSGPDVRDVDEVLPAQHAAESGFRSGAQRLARKIRKCAGDAAHGNGMKALAIKGP